MKRKIREIHNEIKNRLHSAAMRMDAWICFSPTAKVAYSAAIISGKTLELVSKLSGRAFYLAYTPIE